MNYSISKKFLVLYIVLMVLLLAGLVNFSFYIKENTIVEDKIAVVESLRIEKEFIGKVYITKYKATVKLGNSAVPSQEISVPYEIFLKLEKYTELNVKTRTYPNGDIEITYNSDY